MNPAFDGCKLRQVTAMLPTLLIQIEGLPWPAGLVSVGSPNPPPAYLLLDKRNLPMQKSGLRQSLDSVGMQDVVGSGLLNPKTVCGNMLHGQMVDGSGNRHVRGSAFYGSLALEVPPWWLSKDKWRGFRRYKTLASQI